MSNIVRSADSIQPAHELMPRRRYPEFVPVAGAIGLQSPLRGVPVHSLPLERFSSEGLKGA
jgi:hypothetical protein